MDTTAIVTILGVFIANASMIIPLFLWNRAETRANARQIDCKLESIRELVSEIHREVKEFNKKYFAADWDC